MKNKWLIGLIVGFTPVMLYGQNTNQVPNLLQGLHVNRTNLFSNIFPEGYRFAGLEHEEQYQSVVKKVVHQMVKNPDPFINKFGSASTFTWARDYQRVGNTLVERHNEAGHRAFEDTFNYALREVSVSYFPVEKYENDFNDFGAWFLRGAIGNTAEEQLNTVSPIANASEYKWNHDEHGKRTHVGYRIFNQSPYLYWQTRLGWFEKRPLITLNGRLRYNLRRGTEVLEMSSEVAMPHKFTCQFGASADPFHFDSNGGPIFSARLQRNGGSMFDHLSFGYMQTSETLVVLQWDQKFAKW